MHLLLLFLCMASCSLSEKEAPSQAGTDSDNRAFLSLMAGTYQRNGIALSIDPHEETFRYVGKNLTFTYRFIKALSPRSAVYEMELKFYIFYIQENLLLRTQEGAGSAEAASLGNCIIYARRDAGSTDENPDGEPGPGDGNPDGGGTVPGPSGDWGFRSALSSQRFLREGFIFQPDTLGNFLFHGENGGIPYIFQYALAKDIALYLCGGRWVGVRFDENYLQTTPSADRPEHVGLHLLKNYAVQTQADPLAAFTLALTGNLYLKGGTVFSVPPNLRITDTQGGRFYDFIKAVSPACAVYREAASGLFWGVRLENGDIYITQNGLSSLTPETVHFRDKTLFAQKKI